MSAIRIAVGATLAGLLLVASATAGGGSPFNGHYVGKSADGRHVMDVNVNGGAARTTNLKLACPGPPGYADFVYTARIAADGRFAVAARGNGGRAELKLTARAGGGLIRGTLSARVARCKVGPVRFTLRRERS